MLPELCNVRSIGRCFAPLARPCVHVGGPVICAIWRRQIDCLSMGGCDQNQVSNPFSPKCSWPYVTSGWYQHNPPIASSRAQSGLHKCYEHDPPPPLPKRALMPDEFCMSQHIVNIWPTALNHQSMRIPAAIQDIVLCYGGRWLSVKAQVSRPLIFRTGAVYSGPWLVVWNGDILFRTHGSQPPFYSGHSFLYSGHLHFIQDTWFSADGFFGTSCLFIQDVRWV